MGDEPRRRSGSAIGGFFRRLSHPFSSRSRRTSRPPDYDWHARETYQFGQRQQKEDDRVSLDSENDSEDGDDDDVDRVMPEEDYDDAVDHPGEDDPAKDLETRLRNITYEGWKYVLQNTTELLTEIKDTEFIVPKLDLSDREVQYINGAEMHQRVSRFMSVMIQRPDGALNFSRALDDMKLLVNKTFQDRVLNLDRKYFVRPSGEKLDLRHSAAVEIAFRNHIERIEGLAVWAVDLLRDQRVITHDEWYSYSQKKKKYKRYLFELLRERNHDERKRFFEFLEKFELHELHQSLMAESLGPLEFSPNDIPVTRYFVSRKRYASLMDNYFKDWKTGHYRNWILVHGPSGVGKSTIVASFAMKAHNYKMDKVIWVTQGQRSSSDVLKEINSKLNNNKVNEGDPAQDIERVYQKESKRNRRILLVLDDLTDKNLATTLTFFRQYVIITSVFKDIMEHCYAVDKQDIYVRPFRRTSCERLLRKIVGVDQMKQLEDKDSDFMERCIAICQDCEFSPYAISQIGQMLTDTERWQEKSATEILSHLKDTFANYLKDEVNWIENSGIHPAFKIALDSLKESERKQFLKLAVFRNETILPVTMKTIWKLETENQAYDILEKFHACNLIQKQKRGSSTCAFSLNSVQQYSLMKETKTDIKNIVRSIVELYKAELHRFISDQDHFYLENFVSCCIFVGDYECALRMMSNFQFLLQRLTNNAGHYILRDFYETSQYYDKISREFRELWHLCDLMVPQILQLNCPQLLIRTALLHPHFKIFQSLVNGPCAPGKADMWEFNESPRTKSRIWMPNLVKRKMQLKGEGFTDRSFATSMDVSPNGRWIIIGCNNGSLYLVSTSTYEDVAARESTAYIYFVRFTNDQNFVFVSNRDFARCRINENKQGFDLSPEFEEGISVCHDGNFASYDIGDLQSPFIQPVAANGTHLWILQDTCVNCFSPYSELKTQERQDIPSLPINTKANIEDPENVKPIFRFASVISSTDSNDYSHFCAFTYGNFIKIVKYDKKVRKIETCKDISDNISNCSVVLLLENKILYSQENIIYICKWQPKVLPVRKFELDFVPNIALALASYKIGVLGKIGKSFIFFNVSEKSQCRIPVDCPQAIAMKTDKQEAINIYLSFDKGWISKSCLETEFRKRTNECSVPQNAVQSGRYCSTLESIWKTVTRRRSLSADSILLIRWVENLKDYLGIILYDKSGGNSTIKFVLLSTRRVLHTYLLPPNYSQDGELKCLDEGRRIILFNRLLILECFPFKVDGPHVVELASETGNRHNFTALACYGVDNNLAAMTQTGRITKFDGKNWVESDELTVGKRKCLRLFGLQKSDKILGLLKQHDDYYVMLFDLETLMSAIGRTEPVQDSPTFEVSSGEKFCAVVHRERPEIAVYLIPEMRECHRVPAFNVSSLSFRPDDDFKLFISFFDEDTRMLMLKIWDFKARTEDDNRSDFRQLSIHDYYNNTSVFDMPSCPALTGMFVFDCTFFLILTDKCLIRVDPGRPSNESSEIAFDSSWIRESSAIDKCIPGDDGQFLCLSTVDNKVFILKSRIKD